VKSHEPIESMNPVIATTPDEVRRHVAGARQRGLVVGLVATMGALHAGHVSLLRAARKECGFVAASIFVNPTQFGPNEDYTRYPRPIEKDLAICGSEGVDLVFAPEPATMYPPGFCTFVEVLGLQDPLCGASRPGHFRGVATVVLKLFQIVQPDLAYFGQKDAQQVRIIEQLVRDLNVPVRIQVCPIVREPDGLALSSRNQYLSQEDRKKATVLYRALQETRWLIERGERDPAIVRRALAAPIETTPGASLDYAEVVDAETLRPMERLQGTILLAVAVHFGKTRLIDNEMLTI
jgi:pantoate--beta-alanine ligase